MPKVFISHLEADEDLVLKFRSTVLIKGLNIRTDDVFQSSHAGDIKAGASRFDKIVQEIRQADIVIGLLTPLALKSMFVTAELGAAWMGTILTDGADDADAYGSRLERRLFPMLTPPATISDLDGILPHLRALEVDNVTHLGELADAVGRLQTVDRDIWAEELGHWRDFMAEYRSSHRLRPLDTSADWYVKLTEAAQSSGLGDDVLLRYAERTSQSIGLAGGAMATNIESHLSVRLTDDGEYFVYDLSTITSYRDLPPERQPHAVTVAPIEQSDLTQPHSPEPEPFDVSFKGQPWIIHLNPVLRSLDDWSRFRANVKVTLTVWCGEGGRDKREFPLGLSVTEPEADDSPEPEPLAKKEQDDPDTGPLEYAVIGKEVPNDWERISFRFENIPHTVRQPAMYFFSPDICENEWRFHAEAADDTSELEVRASAITSWADVDFTQGSLGGKRGTVAVLRPRPATLLFAQDAVLVTLHREGDPD